MGTQSEHFPGGADEAIETLSEDVQLERNSISHSHP